LMIEAESRKQNAVHYVNFLLNRPVDTELGFEEHLANPAELASLMGEDDLSARPELLQIQTAESIQETAVKASKSYWVPKLNTYADLGSQSFDWAFDRDSKYALLGFNLSVPVFQAGRNRNQIHRNELGLQTVQTQKDLLSDKLELDLELTKNEVKTNQAA